MNIEESEAESKFGLAEYTLTSPDTVLFMSL